MLILDLHFRKVWGETAIDRERHEVDREGHEAAGEHTRGSLDTAQQADTQKKALYKLTSD